MRWDSKNLSQFLDTRKASVECWSWVHIHPSGQWLATDSHSVGVFTGPEIPGLNRPIIVEQGKELLELCHTHGNHEISFKHTNHLIMEWWIKEKVERVDHLETNEDTKVEYVQTKQGQSFDTRKATKEDPQPLAWFTHYDQKPRTPLLEASGLATQLKLLAAMKEGEQASPKPAIVTLASRADSATFWLPNSSGNFRGVLTLNSLFTKQDQGESQ